VEGDVVTSKLVLSRLSPEDSGSRYACKAANNRLQPAPQAHVTVEIILAPIRVEISRTASAFTAGTTYNLTCQVGWIRNSESFLQFCKLPVLQMLTKFCESFTKFNTSSETSHGTSVADLGSGAFFTSWIRDELFPDRGSF
jgi:hypothetical protein